MKLAKYLTILFSIVLLNACKKQYVDSDSETGKSTEKPVKVVKLESLNQVQPVTATGVLVSKKEITLSFKIGGIVNNLGVEEGQFVTKNQRISSLNQSEIDAQILSAQNAYNKSVRDLERATLLYKDSVGTLEQKQNATTAKEINQANLNIVKYNKRYATINAPIKGKVLKRYVEVGELVNAGQPIYTIGSSGTKGAQIIRLGLSDKDIIKIKIGDEAQIEFDAIETKSFQGIVSEISEYSNPQTGLFEVEISINDFNEKLKNGFIAKVSIQPSNTINTYRIPMMSMVEGKQKKAKIFITQNQETVIAQEVNVLEVYDEYFTINPKQIPEKAFVITSGAPYLKTNDSIKVVQ